MTTASHRVFCLLPTLLISASALAMDIQPTLQMDIPDVPVGAERTLRVSIPAHADGGTHWQHVLHAFQGAQHEIDTGYRFVGVQCPAGYAPARADQDQFVMCELSSGEAHPGGDMIVTVRNLAAAGGVIGIPDGVKTRHWNSEHSAMWTFTDSLVLKSPE